MQCRRAIGLLIAFFTAGCAHLDQSAGDPIPPSAAIAELGSGTFIEPEAVRWIEDQPRRRTDEIVVIIPKRDGHVGAVVLHYADQLVLLDQAYEAATISADGRVGNTTLDDAQLQDEFASARAALPARPAQFTVYFLEGMDELTPESIAKFEQVFEEIASHPAPEISVTGHADSVGGRQFNDQLSLARAQRVMKELVRRGVSPSRIVSVIGRGQRDPVIETSPGVSEPLNRRVEIGVR